MARLKFGAFLAPHHPIGEHPMLQDDPHFRDLGLFYEYFDGDNGRGVGASHQTGWSGLVALLIQQLSPHR